MATEAQIRLAEQAVNDLEARKNYCCRDIVTWKSYVRVIAEDTSIVMSDWLDNVAVGTTRRGMPFTVEFALPHDSTKFFDNRSGNRYHTHGFRFDVNLPSTSALAENVFINNAIGCYYDEGEPYCAYANYGSIGTWLMKDGSVLSSGLIYSNWQNPAPLPQFNMYIENFSFFHPANVYYIYKDTTDNKIKIDVKRRDQFRDGEYLALFFTQFVLRNGATL